MLITVGEFMGIHKTSAKKINLESFVNRELTEKKCFQYFQMDHDPIYLFYINVKK